MKILMAATALAGLSACGGSGVDPVPQVPTTQQIANEIRTFSATAARIDRLDDTGPANIPTAGRSTFSGPALMAFERGTTRLALTGESALTIDFGTNDMSGGITRIQGVDAADRPFNVAGRIDYTDGVVGRGAEAGLFAVDYDGVLTARDATIRTDGVAIGVFEGNRATGPIRPRAIQAISGTDGSAATTVGFPVTMRATINGQPAIGNLAFVGEN